MFIQCLLLDNELTYKSYTYYMSFPPQVAVVVPFLGISGNLVEYSVCFSSKSIGITIQHPSGAASLRGASVALAGAGFAGIVEVVREGVGVGVVQPGDVVSKVCPCCLLLTLIL